MDTKRVSAVAGAALLTLTVTASAGPMSVASSNVIAPPQIRTEPAAYRHRHHYRHYGYHHRYYHGYYRRYYGWNPAAAIAGAALGLATLPFALATGGWPYYYGYPYYYYY